jgi:hypothetical protein
VTVNTELDSLLFGKYIYEYRVTLGVDEYCLHESFYNFEITWTESSTVSTVTYTAYVDDVSND